MTRMFLTGLVLWLAALSGAHADPFGPNMQLGAKPSVGDSSLPALLAQRLNKAGDTMAGAINGSTPIPQCIAIETYGGGTGVADNTAALLATAAHLPPNGGCVGFGHGVYNFRQEVDVTLPNASYSLFLKGAGETMTQLVWAAGSSGIKIIGQSQYNTMHVRDVSIETADSSGNYYGLEYTTTNIALGVLAVSDVQNVTFKGADGGNAGNYWGTDFVTTRQSYVNLISDSFFGGQSGGSFHGTGVFLRGNWVSPGVGNYTIANNISLCNFQDVGIGLLYGPYVQGTSIDQTNFQNGGVAISTMTPPSGQDDGILDELTITNSQFGGMTVGNIKTMPGGALDHVLLSNNLFYASGPITSVELAYNYNQVTIVGNTFQGPNGSDGKPTSNAIAFGEGGTATVAGNTFQNLISAVILNPGSSNVTLGINAYSTVTNQVVDQGTSNHLDFIGTDNTRHITDPITNPGMPSAPPSGTKGGNVCYDTNGTFYRC